MGDGFAVTPGRGKSVSSCFYGLYIDTKVMRRPDWTALAFKSNGLGIGHAEADLSRFAALDLWRGIKHLDGEVAAAELFYSGLSA